jgi:hypothetical protein
MTNEPFVLLFYIYHSYLLSHAPTYNMEEIGIDLKMEVSYIIV